MDMRFGGKATPWPSMGGNGGVEVAMMVFRLSGFARRVVSADDDFDLKMLRRFRSFLCFSSAVESSLLPASDNGSRPAESRLSAVLLFWRVGSDTEWSNEATDGDCPAGMV